MARQHTNPAVVIGIATMVLALGGSLYFKIQADAMERDTLPPVQDKLTTVEVYSVMPQLWSLTFKNRGLLKGIEEVMISAEVEGKVLSKTVREGQPVTVGDVVCELDPTLYNLAVMEARAQLSKAEANYRYAKSEVSRIEELDAEQVRPIELVHVRSLRDQAQAAVQVATVALDQAKEMLRRCTITAPIDGTVSAVYYEIGELLGPPRPVVEIVRLNRMKLLVDLTEIEVAQLGDRPRVRIRSRGHGDRDFNGKLRMVHPKADPQTRRIPVEITVDNPDQILRSGVMVDCTIESPLPDGRLLVPAKGVLDEYGAQFVYLAVENDEGLMEVRRQGVNVRPVAGSVRWVQALEGIAYGDQLILSHQQELRPGVVVATRSVSLDGESVVTTREP